MSYTPNPSDPTNPTTSVPAGSMAAEFQALKLYIKQVLQAGNKRNLLINGAMNIDQINNGAAITVPNGTGLYTIDQWAAFSQGGNSSAQQVSAGPQAGSKALSLTMASGVTAAQLVQRVESLYTQGCVSGQIISVSGWIYVSSSGITVTPQIYTPASANNNWSGGINSVGVGTAITLTAGSFVYFEQQIVLTGSCTYGMALYLNIAGTPGGGTVQITQIQMELNLFATPFEYKTFAADLLECQRYTYIYAGNNTWYATSGSVVTWNSPLFFLANLGVTPTIVLINPLGDTGCTTTYGITGVNQGWNLYVIATCTTTGVMGYTFNFAVTSRL